MSLIHKISNSIHSRLIDNGFFSLFKYQGGCIIMYHGIDLNENRSFNRRFFSLKNFKSHLQYFKKHYNVVSLQDFFEKKYDDKKFTISITFDDGYRNNYKYAYPLFEEYKMPATFFITGMNTCEEKIIWTDFLQISSSLTDKEIKIRNCIFEKNGTKNEYVNKETKEPLIQFLKKDQRTSDLKLQELISVFTPLTRDFRKETGYDDYWKLMSDGEISALSGSEYIRVGSHGFYHNNLGVLHYEDAKDELVKSKSYLEGLTGYAIDSIGYPDGSYSREVVELSYSLGYKYQCAVNYLFPETDRQDERILNRLGLYPLPVPETVHRIGHSIVNFEK